MNEPSATVNISETMLKGKLIHYPNSYEAKDHKIELPYQVDTHFIYDI